MLGADEMRTTPLIGPKAWFGPRRFGWGLEAVSVEGWVLTAMIIVAGLLAPAEICTEVVLGVRTPPLQPPVVGCMLGKPHLMLRDFQGVYCPSDGVAGESERVHEYKSHAER